MKLHKFLLFYLKTHEDYRGLERAKEAMIDVAQYSNDVTKDSDHLNIIQKCRVSCVSCRMLLIIESFRNQSIKRQLNQINLFIDLFIRSKYLI